MRSAVTGRRPRDTVCQRAPSSSPSSGARLPSMIRRARLVPLLHAGACFVHQGQGRDVEAVMAVGRWLMRDRILLTMDEATIVQEADRIGRSAWQRLFAEQPTLAPPSGYHPESVM